MFDVQQSHNALSASAGFNQRLWIGAVLLLALILRSINLDASLWFDEIVTLDRYVRLPTSEIIRSYDSLNNHMFFSLQAQLSVAVFGENAWALRLPAMLLGVASVWALWCLAKELVSAEEALLAALLMAVSYHHIWFSQNARGYTGMLFFGLLATCYLLRGARRPEWGVWLAYGACFAASMYTHLSSAVLFLAHGLAYVVFLGLDAFRNGKLARGAIVRPLGGALAGSVLTLALYAPVLGQMGGTFAKVQAGPASAAAAESVAQWKDPMWMITEVIGSLGPLLAPAVPIVLVVMITATIGLWRRAPVLPLILLLHVPITVAVLVALSFRVWPRYFFADLGLICLFLIHGAYIIGDGLAPRIGLGFGRLGRIFALIGIAGTLVLLPRNYLAPKQDFIGARDFVEAKQGPDATIVTIGLTITFRDYYAPDWEGVETLDQLRAVLVSGRETWIVYTFPAVLERRHKDIFDALADGFEKAAYFPGTLSGGGNCGAAVQGRVSACP